MPWTVADVDSHKKGLSAKKKRQWVAVANSVLAKCMKDGGAESECAASAIKQANSVAANEEDLNKYSTHPMQVNSYTTRVEMHLERKHIVVPVIIMVEGVHNGSHGPILHTAEELSRFVEAWNGIPIAVCHPERDGGNVSCNSPDVIEEELVGRVYNAAFENGRLRAEAWLDEERLQAISPETFAEVQNRRPIEVSAGLYSDEELSEGQWNDEHYAAIARNYRPDHLALLPDAVGACSLADGCGIRANKEGGEIKLDVLKAMKDLGKDERTVALLMSNAQGYREVIEKIQMKLNAMDDDSKMYFLQDVFADHFVYEVRHRGGTSSEMYKRGYSVNSGNVEFTGEPAKVVQKVEYVAANQKQEIKTVEGGETMPMTMEEKKKVCPKCVDLIQALIDSKDTGFDKSDEEWMLNLNMEQLEKLVPKAPEKKEEKKEEVTPEMNEAKALDVLSGKFGLEDKKKFLGLFSDVARAQIESGLTLNADMRTNLIKSIMTCTDDVYTKEELEAKDTAELQKLARVAKPKIDFGLRNAGDLNVNADNGDSEEPLVPCGVTLESKKEVK